MNNLEPREETVHTEKLKPNNMKSISSPLLSAQPQCEQREVHPLKSIGCFIKKPITAEQLLRRIREELRVNTRHTYTLIAIIVTY